VKFVKNLLSEAELLCNSKHEGKVLKNWTQRWRRGNLWFPQEP